MMRYLLIALALYGGVRLLSSHYGVHEFHDVLAFSKKHPSPTFSPTIDYYAGVSYYQRSEYPQAQEAFSQLLQDYPTAQYAASALVRLEDSAEYNKDWPVAKTACEKYVEQFPNGSESQVIEQRLQVINFKHNEAQ